MKIRLKILNPEKFKPMKQPINDLPFNNNNGYLEIGSSNSGWYDESILRDIISDKAIALLHINDNTSILNMTVSKYIILHDVRFKIEEIR